MKTNAMNQPNQQPPINPNTPYTSHAPVPKLFLEPKSYYELKPNTGSDKAKALLQRILDDPARELRGQQIAGKVKQRIDELNAQ